MNTYESGSPEVVKVAELTWEELAAPSGIYDQEQGRDLTNLQAIELIELARGSQGISMSSNGALSAEAAQHNSDLHRKRLLTVEKMIVAVLSKRPPL